MYSPALHSILLHRRAALVVAPAHRRGIQRRPPSLGRPSRLVRLSSIGDRPWPARDDVRRVAIALRSRPADIRNMIHRSTARILGTTSSPLQVCSPCRARHRAQTQLPVAIRAWFEYWQIECEHCGTPFSSLGPPNLTRCNPAREEPVWFESIRPAARLGAHSLEHFARFRQILRRLQASSFFGSSAETVGASGVYRGLVLSLSRPAGGFVDNTSALPTTPQPPHRQKRRYHPPPRQASLRLIAADLRVCQEAEQLAAGRVEGALRGVGLTMGEQRPAIVADEGEDDLLDWPPPEVAVHLQSADDLTAESPDVVAVSAQGLA